MKIQTFIFISISINIIALWNADSGEAHDWGGVLGVQMGIVVSNKAVTFDSGTTVECRIRNHSTNAVYIQQPSWGGTSIVLINEAGKIYRITPARSFSFDMARKVGPNETWNWAIRLTIPKTIPPGLYRIRASRNVIKYEERDRRITELISNEVEINLKGGSPDCLH